MPFSAYIQDCQKLCQELPEQVWGEITKDETGVVLAGYDLEGNAVSKTRHRNTSSAKRQARELGICEEHWFET